MGLGNSVNRRNLLALVMLVGVGLGRAYADQTPTTRPHQLRFAPKQSEWIELPKPEPGTAAGDLAAARAALAEQQYGKARKLIRAWQKSYGSSSEFLPQALLLEARAEKGLRNYYDAYQVLDRLISDFRATEAADDGVVELFNIAEVYLSGVRRKLWGMRLLDASELALDILDRITAEFAGTRLAELALKTKADYFFQRGDFPLAELELARLLQEYPESQYRRYAMKLSADAALASFTGVRFDDAPLVEAEERYRMYAREYPDDAGGVSPILETIRERRAEKELEIGRYYRKIDEPEAAVFYFESVQAHWPDTAAAAQAVDAIRAMEGHADFGGDAMEAPLSPENREYTEP
jgi:outer membrane protein assembly factor BamD (BamD/ComL family)